MTLDAALQLRCSRGEIGENELCLISREKSEKAAFAVEKRKTKNDGDFMRTKPHRFW